MDDARPPAKAVRRLLSSHLKRHSTAKLPSLVYFIVVVKVQKNHFIICLDYLTNQNKRFIDMYSPQAFHFMLQRFEMMRII